VQIFVSYDMKDQLIEKLYLLI